MNFELEKRQTKQVLMQKELYKVNRWEGEKKKVNKNISVITATPVFLIEGKLSHMLL